MFYVSEVTLDELLNDPIIQLVMEADGVSKDDILDLYAAVPEDTEAEEEMPAFMCGRLLERCFGSPCLAE